MGDINVYSGPMKCGKTQQLLNEFNRHIIAGKNVQIFKPKVDNRLGENLISSREGKKIQATNIENIEDLKNYNADVFFIDEFQFLNGDVSLIEKMAENGKKFYIAGLNLTSEKKTFGKMGDLMCIADNVKIMTSVCEICKNDNAIFSYFKGEKNCNIAIGDKEYIPVCRTCYQRLCLENKNSIK